MSQDGPLPEQAEAGIESLVLIELFLRAMTSLYLFWNDRMRRGTDSAKQPSEAAMEGGDGNPSKSS